ncbi:PspC domain-containing protein [Pedobacter sp. SYSU D00535]|uniref:PspC domain-containing protein n=1 Tax=Pedobacter sp. SYSU D00535 TaxID=2810308 RepID=UPI001A9760F5|nr:PspC domain-containing protein [Pedobacter sp. SYSU D00535]
MNKTIIININGLVFHIEEEAYEILRSYMTEVKRHFAYTTDSLEIVTDIENRLAEMFNERLAEQKKQVLEMIDIQEVIAAMGSVKDFELPEEENPLNTDSYRTERKLFRDTDDKLVAGVCSGLGYYFDIEAKWIRLVTVLLTLTVGVALPIYIILWLVLPKALTRQDKIAMRGEPITLQSFKKSFDEEIGSLQDNLNRGFNTISPGASRTGDSLSNGIDELLAFVVRFFKGLVKAIGVLVIVIGVIVLLGLICGLLFAIGFWNSAELNAFPISAINYEYRSPIYLSAFLLLFIPLIALILFAIRVIFNRRIVTRTGSFAMLILWLTGLATGVYYGSKVAAEFKEDAKIELDAGLINYPALYLKLNPQKPLSKDDSLKLNLNSERFRGRILNDDYGDEFDEMQEFNLFIEKSENAETKIVKEFSARGRTFKAALQAAQRTSYNFIQKDSTILFDKYLHLNGKGLYRAQDVNVTLKIPVNTRLIIDGTLSRHLENYHLWYCQPEDSDWKTPSEWLMTEEGLKCVDDSLYRKKTDK